MDDNSIDLREFISLEKMTAQDDLRISRDDGRKILCVAAHNEKKGIDVLLHALAKMREMEEDIKLLLVDDWLTGMDWNRSLETGRQEGNG